MQQSMPEIRTFAASFNNPAEQRNRRAAAIAVALAPLLLAPRVRVLSSAARSRVGRIYGAGRGES